MNSSEVVPAGLAPAPVRSLAHRIVTASVFAIGALVLCGAAYFVGANMARSHTGSSNIVVVDVSAIVNAQRAAMAMDPTEGRMLTMRAGKIAEEVIRQIAGPDAVILVKQSVVALDTTHVRDITQDVLEALQLPTDAPPTMKIPPVASHLYTEQGQQQLARDNQRREEEEAQNKAYLEEKQRKDSLIP